MRMKTGIRIAAALIATVAACILLLVISACLPRALIQTQSENSAAYFADRQPFVILFGDYIHAMQDNYSDTVLCNIAYCIDPAHPFTSAVRAQYAQGEYEEAYEGYRAVVNGKKEPEREYGRYWHGSLVLIRPLLTLMPVAMIRLLCGTAIVLLQAMSAAVLIRRQKKAFAVCWLMALLLIHPWMLFTSLEYGTAFLAASAASLVLLLKKERTDAGTMPFFAAVGVVTCFVDFLTTETLTFTMPMLLLLVERCLADERCAERHSALQNCKSVVKNGLSWLSGYLGMFAVKIAVLAVVAGEDTARSSLGEGLYRLGGEVRTANISTAPVVDFGKRLGGAIWHNLACLYPTRVGEMKASGVWLATGFIITAGFVLVYLLHDRINRELFIPMGMVAALPYLRFLVLSNHSYEHFFITYRAQTVTIAVFLFFVFENGIRHLIHAKKGANAA